MLKRNHLIADRRVDLESQRESIMSISEARAEAAFLVLSALLSHLPRGTCAKAALDAFATADNIGHEDVAIEVEDLLADFQRTLPTVATVSS